jgi:hypothetical protein
MDEETKKWKQLEKRLKLVYGKCSLAWGYAKVSMDLGSSPEESDKKVLT